MAAISPAAGTAPTASNATTPGHPDRILPVFSVTTVAAPDQGWRMAHRDDLAGAGAAGPPIVAMQASPYPAGRTAGCQARRGPM
ncbi:hypothetical protein QMK61_03555 [Fulvimonas sp. R45]|nr:hypothetical protein [Fulvimonas sp. R45]